MIRQRYDLTFELQAPLHIGTGETRHESFINSRNQTEEREVASLVTDRDGRAWIPGATLKGALRSIPGKESEALFGVPHVEGSTQARGALTFRGAVTNQLSVVTLAQTCINKGTGASAANLLFARDAAEVGTVFTTSVWLEADKTEISRLREAFESRLAVFARPGGYPVGRNKSDGMGSLQLSSVTIVTIAVGQGAPIPLSLTPPSEKAAVFAHRFHCPGPYLSKGKTEGYTIHAQRNPDGRPRLLASGVSGSLRARANWLLQLSSLRKDGKLTSTDKDCATSSGSKKLGAVDRLFGDEGRRGSLDLRVSDVTAEGRCRVPGVMLDRLTQAPVQHALFEFEADFGVAFILELRLFRPLDSEESALVSALGADLKANGLFLGMGTSKGMGWFGSVAGEPSEPNPQPQDMPSSVFSSRLPDARVTLPYRIAFADPDHVGMPEDQVASAVQSQTLHSIPLTGGRSGWLDVSWCFETPVLVGDGGAVKAFQRIGDVPHLPGSTVRGFLRAAVESLTEARLWRALESVRDDSAANRTIRQTAAAMSTGPHDPQVSMNYAPDFTEALFGFVRETDEPNASASHGARHLKSRLAFSFARLIGGVDEAKSQITYTHPARSPKLIAAFYDEPGRKTYWVDNADAPLVARRLAIQNRQPHPTNTTSFKLLQPAEGRRIVFRGRIRFHNVSELELGALLYAVTLAAHPGRRHSVGQARPFGAGRCFAADMRLCITPNAGVPVDAVETDARLGIAGHSGVRFLLAFQNWCRRTAPGVEEFLASREPVLGAALRRHAGLADEQVVYQSTALLADGRRPPNYLEPADQHDARARNGGRLAAMLRRAP